LYRDSPAPKGTNLDDLVRTLLEGRRAMFKRNPANMI
jgi:hypothetical protein